MNWNRAQCIIVFLLLLLFCRSDDVSANLDSVVENSQIHSVEQGDTLWGIAKKYYNDGGKWVELAKINNLQNPRLIHRGNKIKIGSETEITKNDGNLLNNSDFERSDIGIFTNWQDTQINLNKWYIIQNEVKREDQYMQYVNLDEYGGSGYGIKSIDKVKCPAFCSTEAVQIVSARPGIKYRLFAKGKIIEGSWMSLYLDFLDINRNRIDVKTTGGYSTKWSIQSVEAISPPDTKYIRVILYTANDSYGVFLWDNANLSTPSN